MAMMLIQRNCKWKMWFTHTFYRVTMMIDCTENHVFSNVFISLWRPDHIGILKNLAKTPNSCKTWMTPLGWTNSRDFALLVSWTKCSILRSLRGILTRLLSRDAPPAIFAPLASSSLWWRHRECFSFGRSDTRTLSCSCHRQNFSYTGKKDKNHKNYNLWE